VRRLARMMGREERTVRQWVQEEARPIRHDCRRRPDRDGPRARGGVADERPRHTSAPGGEQAGRGRGSRQARARAVQAPGVRPSRPRGRRVAGRPARPLRASPSTSDLKARMMRVSFPADPRRAPSARRGFKDRGTDPRFWAPSPPPPGDGAGLAPPGERESTYTVRRIPRGGTTLGVLGPWQTNPVRTIRATAAGPGAAIYAPNCTIWCKRVGVLWPSPNPRQGGSA